MAKFDQLNEKFEKAPAEDILAWAIETYSPKIGLTSSFGAQSAVLLHMATQIKPDLPIFFLDTGFLFKETHQYADQLKKQLGLNLKTYVPPAEAVAEVRRRLDANDPKCCDEIKVEGLKWALQGLDAWIAGLRREQASTRKNAKIIEEYHSGLVKIHPIANWTSKDVYDYMKKNNLPFHPLWEQGYTSIGCEPCTRKPIPGQDDRSGRWAGSQKTECGIHTFMEKKEE